MQFGTAGQNGYQRITPGGCLKLVVERDRKDEIQRGQDGRSFEWEAFET